MTLMTMDEKLILRDERIDRNHQELYDLIDLLAISMESGKANRRCVRIADELVDVAEQHLAMEDALMIRHRHPQVVEHKNEHIGLIASIVDFRNALEAGLDIYVGEQLKALRNKLSAHITQSDKTLVAELRNQNYCNNPNAVFSKGNPAMSALTMNKNLILNYSKIDNDHQKLFDLINQLAATMKAGEAKQACSAVINELTAYTKTHFSMEEALMSHHGYSQAAAHKTEHDKFIKNILDFKSKFEAGSGIVTIEILTFLRDWLSNHIQKTDKALVAVLPAA
ncbi:MAG: bacteriohemerythrin [Rhodocyclaceae bacterium]